MSDLNLLYTDVEDSLRDSVRDLLTDRCAPDRIIALYDGKTPDPALWRTLATEVGLAGLLVPEDRGGAGASAREAAVVLEELGRFVAPVPFLTSAVVATTVALAGTDDELVCALAAGARTAALLVPFSASPGHFEAVVEVAADTLRGKVTSVAGAVDADVLLVPVRTADGVAVHAVEASAAAVSPLVSLDMSRPIADVDVTGAASTPLVPAGDGAAVIRQAIELGAALLASEQVGVAQWCLDTTVAYLKERRQFGRVVGGFQAIKHRLADLYATVESARAAARYAAATVAADDPDRHVAGALAKAYCSPAAVTAAEECVQLHGGIGMTWEHPAHLYLKRAKADELAFGTPAAHRRRLAEFVDLPAASPGR